MLPFAINAVTAIVDLYPYGGTRHSAFLVPFAIAGVSLAIVKLTRQGVVAASLRFYWLSFARLLDRLIVPIFAAKISVATT